MWPFKPKPVQLDIEVVERVSSKLRLGEFQSDPALTSAATRIISDAAFQLMMQVNRNENPSLIHLSMDAPLETRALHQARIEGYNMALANFEAMAIHKPLPAELVATFEEEER